MNENIIYEQPVSENIRNILKCEYLYEKYNAALVQDNIWGIKSCVATLLETSDLLTRINLKIELLKELEKNIIYIKNLKEKDEISLEKFDKSGAVNKELKTLQQVSGKMSIEDIVKAHVEDDRKYLSQPQIVKSEAVSAYDNPMQQIGLASKYDSCMLIAQANGDGSFDITITCCLCSCE